MSERYTPNWRDRIAHRLACEALRIGTPTYRAFVNRVNQRGMEALYADLDAQMDGLARIMTNGKDETR